MHMFSFTCLNIFVFVFPFSPYDPGRVWVLVSVLAWPRTLVRVRPWTLFYTFNFHHYFIRLPELFFFIRELESYFIVRTELYFVITAWSLFHGHLGGGGIGPHWPPPPLSPHSGLRTALEDTSLKIKPWEPRWWIETKLCLVFGPPRIISWTPKKIISWTPQKSFCGPQKPFRSPQVKNHCCGTQIGQ